MTDDIWYFLQTPAGVELTHAVVILITAIAAYLSYLAHRQSRRNAEALNGHLEAHTARSQSPTPPPLSDLPPEA